MIPRTFRFDKFSFNPSKVLEQSSTSPNQRAEAPKRVQADLKEPQSGLSEGKAQPSEDHFSALRSKVPELPHSPFKVRSLWKRGGEELALFQHPAKMLLGYHGTQSGFKALGAALGLAKKFQCPLTISEILTNTDLDEDFLETQEEVLQKKMQKVFDKFFDPAYRKKYPPQVKVAGSYQTVDGLLHLAHQDSCGLMIVGRSAKNRSKMEQLQSIPSQLIQKAPCPVLVWPENRDSLKVRNIMVPTDGTPISYSAMAQAIVLCKTFSADMFLFQVTEQAAQGANEATSKAQDMMKNMDLKDVNHDLMTGQGSITDTIADFCDKQSIDLIVMATHLSPLPGQVMPKSLTVEVMHRVKVPVIAVHGKG